MNGRTLLVSGVAALAIATSPTAFAQTSSEGSNHHPADTNSSQQSGSSRDQAQGMPMGPGMMQRPGMMMGQGQMGPGMIGPGMMTQGQMGPGMMMGQGQMGPGMMGGGMMHPGMMMGQHPHYGMMAPWMMGRRGMIMGGWGHGRRLSLSADDVKRIVDGRLVLRGFKHLKAGPVKIVDDDTASADVVTKEGSLAARLRVDRNTGYAVIAE